MPQQVTLTLDIETFSPVDLAKSGVYVYSAHPDFQIQLLSYCADGQNVRTIDLANGEKIPETVLRMLEDTSVRKSAFNAMFERICLSRYLGYPVGEYLNPRGWYCDMIHSAYLGLPLSLDNVGEVLGVERQKLKEGKSLIQLFAKPNRKGEQVLPSDRPEEWERYKEYNKRDVETEMDVAKRLSRFPVPEFVWEEYWADCKINDLGVLIDTELAQRCVEFDERSSVALMDELRYLTGLDNPNSVAQLKSWLARQGCPTDKLGKADVLDLLGTAEKGSVIERVLQLRQQASMSSVKKYTAMLNCIDTDKRARGLFQFYGSHTGRESGRRIQLQNMPRGALHDEDLTTARELVKSGDYDGVEVLYGNVPNVLSSLCRSALIPREGCKFVASDFSSIENRSIAWLADEQKVLDVFLRGEDVYKYTACSMFGVKYEDVDKEMRQKSKIATLAGGYGGGVGAYKAFGADKPKSSGGLGLSDEDIQRLVTEYRQANPNIVRYWYTLENACKAAIKHSTATELPHGITIYYKAGMLVIRLPSGRELFYQKTHLTENRFGGESVGFYGIGMSKKWEKHETYAGKICENVTQAVARDLLYNSILELQKEGFDIVLQCHDECVVEVPDGTSAELINEIMARVPVWAKGLPLKAEGELLDFYQK